MHHTLIALVEDKPGVLNRVASLFRRRNFNIESLTVGRTAERGVSRMTIVIDSDQASAERVTAYLYKLVNVLQVEATVQRARAEEGTVLIDFRVEQEDSVYPMVPAGADLHAMIRRPEPSILAETGADPI